MKLSRLGLVAPLLSSLALVACGEDAPSAEPGAGGSAAQSGSGASVVGSAGGGGSGGAAGATLAWEPCPVFEEYPPLEDTATQAGECAKVEAPLFRDVPDGPTLELFVKRVRSTVEPATRQVWLLNGGPGAASEELDPILLRWAEAVPGLEVYTTDFRGVGASTPLPCSDAQIAPGQLQHCVASVEREIGDLDAFTTTQAAHDVFDLVERTRGDAPVMLYGLSFGTFWAHRVLQLAPDLFAGAVLDSIASPEADFSTYSPDADRVAQDFFARCALDATCAAKLGADPWTQVEAFFALPPSSACPGAGLDQPTWKSLLARAIRKVQTRPLVPALVYRLLRCAPEDQAAVGHLLDFMGQIPPEPDSAFHVPLYAHIVLSELWDTSPLTAAEYAAIDQSLSIAPGGTDAFQALWSQWPRTPEDDLANAIATTRTPLLLLQGGLDPQTALFRAHPFASALEAQGHAYVLFPDAPHALIAQTPIAGESSDQCADLLVRAFLADPSVTTHACQANAQPIDFGDNAALAAMVLGTGSIWENVPVPADAADADPRPRDLARALQELRRAR